MGRALYFYLVLLLVMIPLSIVVTLFVLLYTLAITGPWLSGKISLKDKFRKGIDLIFGIDPIHRFRGDIKSIVGGHSKLEVGDRRPSEIRSDIYEIHQDARDQAERGEFIIAIVTGVGSLVVGTLTGTSVIVWLLGSYSIVMTLTIGLHVVVLDILTYNKEDDLTPYRRKHLVILEGWNRAILTSRRTQASVLMVGVLYRISPIGYEIAKDLLDEAIKRDMGHWEQSVFIAGALSEIAGEIISKGV